MESSKRTDSPRWLLPAMLLLGVFVLCDIGLFGVLIFRSLSQREIRQIVLEARSEAEELAEQIAGEASRRGDDLWTAIATESETQIYIDSVLAQRKIVDRVELRDREGRVVFFSETEDIQGPTPDIADIEAPRLETRTTIRERPFQEVEVPVGEFGTFVIGISRAELDHRLQILRAELIRQAVWIAILTVALIVGAYALVWRLLRRTRRLESKTKEAERLAYVGTLASGLAHEIRSPLNSLHLNMQMLEEEVQESGTITSGRRLMAITRSEIGRLEELVTDFLSYARPRERELERVSPSALLEHAAEVLSAQIDASGAQVSITDRSAGRLVEVDRAQMNQLLLNLMHNALEATADGDREPRIHLETRPAGEGVVLSVRDNGVGMTEEERQRMFEVFYSTRKGGTGLGLAIVERIVRSHDGSIEVRSTPGKGTVVEVHLAAASEPTPAERPSARAGPILSVKEQSATGTGS